MTEGTAEQQQNPHWIAANERLKSVGVSMMNDPMQMQMPPQQYYFQMPPVTPLYTNPYAPPPMPQLSADQYNWHPPPPSQPRSQYNTPPTRAPHRYRQPAPRTNGNSIPFNYSSIQNNYRPGGFRMQLPQRPQRPNGFTNPLTASNPADDILGDPDSGFCVRGKHPATLKEYVKRALAYPQTAEDKYKCETYLYARIQPLVSSGSCFAVRWETEPLPHEKNYELTTGWTPSAKLKTNSTSPKKERFDPRKRSLSPMYPKGKYDDFSKSLPAPSRRPENVKESKKNVKKRKQEMSKLDRELMDKRGKFDTPTRYWGDNFLQDWIDQNRHRKPTDIKFVRLTDTFRKRSNIPNHFHTKLARSYPRVLRSLDQGVVDDFFNRNEDRFNPNDYDEVVGTCMDIEKKFFRLTKKPDAIEIRPPNVLRRAFDRLKSMARDTDNYKYICDQLRAIRQDLTVQKIRNEFTVAVYEFHARLTLENKDMGEFNQCQSQLRHLYADIHNCPNEDEFAAYRLLYFIYTRDDQDILTLLNSVSEKAKRQQCLSFAIRVHDAFLKGHHIRLFKMLDNPPRMCRNVMDLFVERERKRFFNVIRASFRPTVKVDVLARWFNFEGQKVLCEFAVGADLKPNSTTEPAKWPKL